MTPIPNSAYELIEELEGIYPPKCKDPNESLEQHARYAGAVELVEALRLRANWTKENARVSDIDPTKGF